MTITAPAGGPTRLQYALALLVTLLGLSAFDLRLRYLWQTWMDDALRSIGLVVLPVALWLALRRWQQADWQRGGTWWGLVPLLLTVAIGLFDGANHLQLGGQTIMVFPLGVLVSGYLMGAVLLFGGVPAWRRALFPLLLVVLINPIPSALEKWLDLPLQEFGARVARGFADLLGVPLQGDLLHLMFEPDRGVFIAPGCNGLRGAVTLAFLALVGGHLYRLRFWPHLAYVTAGILAAYLLNLIRLCVVVAYTAAARHMSPAWYGFGEQFDYLAGGLLFVLTVLAFLQWPRRHPELCSPES